MEYNASSASAPGPPARPHKRSRTRQACDRCRDRKTKCSDQRPCQPCILAGSTCEDWRPGAPGPDQGGGQAPARAEPAHHQHHQHHHHHHVPPPTTTYSAPRNEHPSLSPPVKPKPSVLDFVAPAAPYSGSGAVDDVSAWPHRPRDDRLLRLAFPYDSVYKNERGRFRALGLSSGLGTLSYLHQHHKLLSSTNNPLDSFLVDMPAEALLPPELASRDPGAPCTFIQPCPQLWDMVTEHVPPNVIWALVRQFLESTYLLWPTFLLPTFVEKCGDEDARSTPDFMMLLLSICALTARERLPPATTGEDVSSRFFDLYWQVKRRFPRVDQSTLPCIQSCVYMALYCYGGSGTNGVLEGHTLSSEAVSFSLDIGLHRSVDAYTATFTPVDIEIRNRTLWAVYCVDKMSAFHGRPSMLRLNDIDIEEMNTSSAAFSERLSSSSASFLAYIRTFVRLMVVLERVLEKINIPSCTGSSAVNKASTGIRRIKETIMHSDADCPSLHAPVTFNLELQMLDDFMTRDLATPSRQMEDDNMFDCHRERLRTWCSSIKAAIYRHLVTVANTDIGIEPPVLKHAEDVLYWTQDALSSQRKMIERGSLTDCGSTCAFLIGQAGLGIIPIIYLSRPVPSPHLNLPDTPYQIALSLSMQLLCRLSDRFPAASRSLNILDDNVSRLDIALPTKTELRLPTGAPCKELKTGSGEKARWIVDLPLSNPLALISSAFDFTTVFPDCSPAGVTPSTADMSVASHAATASSAPDPLASLGVSHTPPTPAPKAPTPVTKVPTPTPLLPTPAPQPKPDLSHVQALLALSQSLAASAKPPAPFNGDDGCEY